MDSHKNKVYEELAHTADLFLRFFGKDYPDLIMNVFFGLIDYLGINYSEKHSSINTIKEKFTDIDFLLINLINDWIYYLEKKKVLIPISIHLKERVAILKFKMYEVRQIRMTIKAATFHKLSIKQSESNYSAEIVFDL